LSTSNNKGKNVPVNCPMLNQPKKKEE